MIRGMEPRALGEFVAAVWRRQGWEAKTTTMKGDLFVVVQRAEPRPERGLIWIVADPEGSIGAERLVKFHEFCRNKGAGEAAVVTSGGVTDDARRHAAQRNVGLLDADAVAEMVRNHDLGDLVETYGGEPGGSGGSDDGPIDKVREAVSRARAAAPAVPRRVAVAVLLALAVVVAGVVVGPSVLGLGGGEEAPTDSVTARSLTPADGDGLLLVSWDATRTDVVDPDPDDDAAYYPREGRTFLVVELKITNAGGSAVPVSESGFLLETNGTVLGHQPLAGADGLANGEVVPGDTVFGWVAFSAPADAGNATLVADGGQFGRGNVTVQFSRDAELEVTTTA